MDSTPAAPPNPIFSYFRYRSRLQVSVGILFENSGRAKCNLRRPGRLCCQVDAAPAKCGRGWRACRIRAPRGKRHRGGRPTKRDGVAPQVSNYAARWSFTRRRDIEKNRQPRYRNITSQRIVKCVSEVTIPVFLRKIEVLNMEKN